MRSRLIKKICLWGLLFPLALMAGCGGDSETQELLDRGESYLVEASYDQAAVTYQMILDQHDAENTQAMFGVVLSRLLKQLTTMGAGMGMVYDFIFQAISGLETSSSSGFYPQAEGINAALETALNEVFLDTLNEILDYLDTIKEDSAFKMNISTLPIEFGSDPETAFSADLGGEFDLGEVYLLAAIGRYLESLAQMALSADFNLNTETIQGLAGKLAPVMAGEQALIIDRDYILDTLALVADTSPNFLRLEPTQGAARMLNSAELAVLSIDNLLSFIDTIESEGDDQSDDFIAYEVREGKKNAVLQLTDETGERVEVPVEYNDDSILSVQTLKASYQSSGGQERVSWTGDVAPFLGLLLQGIIQSGILDPLLEYSRPLVEEYIGSENLDLIDNMLGTLQTMATGGLLAGGMVMIIPDVIEVDFGQLHHNPPEAFLRLLFPAVVDDSQGDPELLIEYECPETLRPSDVICPYPEAVTSAAHFVGTGFEIADDGIDSPLPYLSFQDPSLGGFVYLNLNPLNSTQFPDQYEPPGSYEFNFFLGAVLGEYLAGMP